jgi:hypothetical protein
MKHEFRVGDVFRVNWESQGLAGDFDILTAVAVLKDDKVVDWVWERGLKSSDSFQVLYKGIEKGEWVFLYNRFDRAELHEMIGYDS